MLVKVRHTPEELTETELSQYFSTSRALWIWYQEAFHQQQASLLDGDAFNGILIGMKGSLSLAGTRAFWAMTRTTFSPDFALFVDEIIKTVPVGVAARRHPSQ